MIMLLVDADNTLSNVCDPRPQMIAKIDLNLTRPEITPDPK